LKKENRIRLKKEGIKEEFKVTKAYRCFCLAVKGGIGGGLCEKWNPKMKKY